jgi:quinoprotein glucose dehydrogenase
VALLTSLAASQKTTTSGNSYREWRAYGGGPENIHYSTLDQINRSNVHKLEVAWSFDTGDGAASYDMECNPIIVHGLLFGSTPKLRVIALEADTGKLRWSFNPNETKVVSVDRHHRGVAYWEDGKDRRIYFVASHFLHALDASTGRLVAEFGKGGRVDLREGLGRDLEEISITATTPGVVYKDLFILGSAVSEELPSSPGYIRAYDLRSGKLRWTFHTIPNPGEFGYETWPKEAWKHTGGANNWGGMCLDENRGLVFAPTGSAAFDFYGPDRVGDNLFANSLVALKADTGKRVWHFQAVKHDLWDRDFPTAPSLVTIKRDGRMIDAVAQITKSGHAFVFERETGKPLFPIEYRKVAASDVEGEITAETQPFPLKPPPFARQEFTEEIVTRRTPEAHRAVLEQLRKVRSAGQFVPPSLQGTVVFPGFDGGGEWGGASFDPETELFYVNSNEMAWVLRLVPRPVQKSPSSARDLYLRHCSSCHREDLQGNPPEFPALIGIGKRLQESEITVVIRQGRGRMPAFSRLPIQNVRAISRYLSTGQDTQLSTELSDPGLPDLKYTIDGYNKFLDPEGYPAIEPPWGTLNAINLGTGEIVWKIPLGEFPELAEKGMRNTGSENYGGSVVTAGGLLFIGATTHDKKFRAFDKLTGKLLWEKTLPADGNATPATYEIAGRQYVVIAAGGGKWGQPAGGSFVAFALPWKEITGEGSVP